MAIAKKFTEESCRNRGAPPPPLLLQRVSVASAVEPFPYNLKPFSERYIYTILVSNLRTFGEFIQTKTKMAYLTIKL